MFQHHHGGRTVSLLGVVGRRSKDGDLDGTIRVHDVNQQSFVVVVPKSVVVVVVVVVAVVKFCRSRQRRQSAR